MPAVIVNEDRCLSSQVCVNACPYKAIDMVINERGREVAWINDKCVDCLLCVPACPQQAIVLVATYGMATEPDVYNGIWAVVPDSSVASLGFVTRASSLARSMHAWTGVVLLGSDNNETALRSAGADTVVHPGQLTDTAPPNLLDDLVQLVDERQPEAMLFSDNLAIRSLATRLAGQLHIDLVTDVCDVVRDEHERRLLFYKAGQDTSLRATMPQIARPQLAVLTATS